MRIPKPFRKTKIQILRAVSLTLVLLFFILVPLSNWYANNKMAYNHPHLVGLASGKVAGQVYFILDQFYSLWEDPITAATSNNGSLWAFTILGLPLSDPVGLISELVNSVKFPLKYVLGGIIPFIIALLFGRVFCAWLCPMTILYAISNQLRKLLLFLRFPLLGVRLEVNTRIFVFWLGLILSYFFGAWVWHFVLPYISLTHEMFSWIVFSNFTVGFYFLIAMIVLDIGLIPGGYCESVCPTGWLLSYFGKFSLLQLKSDSKNCPKKCTKCKTACPIDLFPRENKLHSCHLCMKCVDVCPKKHINLAMNSIYKSKILAENSASGGSSGLSK